MSRAPSLKTLREHWSNEAPVLRRLMTGKLDPTDERNFPQTNAWLRQCYHRPTDIELIMSAINETIDGFGVEGIWEGHEHSSGEVIAEYVNMGDTYAPTLLYSHYHDRFEVISWGDWVEWAEQQRLIESD